MFGSSVADLYLQTVSVETQKLDNLTGEFIKAADDFLILTLRIQRWFSVMEILW